MTIYTGGCACGAVRYEIAAEPIRGFYCQCRDCQRDTGSGHSAVAVFPSAALRLIGEASENLRNADSGAQKRKGFCAKCGSPLYNKPQIVMFASHGQNWDHLDPALPRLAGMRPGA